MGQDQPYISLGAQMGDVKSDEIVDPLLQELKELLAKFCKGPYSSAVDELAPVVRVDVEIWHWDFEGCQQLRWSRKNRYITVDIGVPRAKWENKHLQEIRTYLMDNLSYALKLMTGKLKKEKQAVNEDLLLEELTKVKEKYLSYHSNKRSRVSTLDIELVL